VWRHGGGTAILSLPIPPYRYTIDKLPISWYDDIAARGNPPTPPGGETQEVIEMSKATTVINLSTGDEMVYCLPAKEAVKNAFWQFERKNYNTWEYPELQVVEGKYSYSCGDYAALKEA
jgi:hypothetical protein